MKWISDLIDLIFPRHCNVCGDILSPTERDICLNCLYSLPKIEQHHLDEIEKIFWGIDVPGYATIIVLILFFGCVQLFCIGIIGEYVGRTFEQSKNRPVYIAKETLLHEDKN